MAWDFWASQLRQLRVSLCKSFILGSWWILVWFWWNSCHLRFRLIGEHRPKCFRTINGLESRPVTCTSSHFCITSSDFHIHWEAGSIEVAKVTFWGCQKNTDNLTSQNMSKNRSIFNNPQLVNTFWIKKSTLVNHQTSPIFHTYSTGSLDSMIWFIWLLSLSQELLESCNEQGTPLGLVIDLVAQLRWPRCGIFDDYIGLYEENWFERWIKFR